MLGMKLEQARVRAMPRGDDSVWQLLADEAWKLSGEDHKAMKSFSSAGACSGGQAAGAGPGHDGTEEEGQGGGVQGANGVSAP